MEATKKLILVAILAAVLPCTASAATSVNDGYLADSAGSIVKNGSGGCWHTGYWMSAMAVAECDAVAAKDEIKPSPKVSAMPPPPQSAPVQEKMPPLKFNLSEEDSFDFDKAVLKPKGKEMLDDLVSKLVGTDYEVIYVTGYTDRIGSAEYNQRLSLRRADVVKNYLESKGIPADRIKAEGKGKTQPITKPTDCKGMTKVRAIACLQPDRRTEVTVDGIKASVQ
jgi:OOP family OmpA-OmpF porin